MYVCIYIYIIFLYIEMTNNYYQKRNERLRKEAREIKQNLLEEEKSKWQIKVLRKKSKS